MELKPFLSLKKFVHEVLLIVPYGIETYSIGLLPA